MTSWLSLFCFALLLTLESDGGPLSSKRRKKVSGGENESSGDTKEKFDKVTQAEFDKHVEENVNRLLQEYAMEVDKKTRKNFAEEANEPSEHQGWLSADEFAAGAQQASKFYMDEDTGIQIPGVHPFYNLPVHVQLLILDLPAARLDNVLDYIDKNAPNKDLEDDL